MRYAVYDRTDRLTTLAKNAAYMRERYRALRSAGICVRCKNAEAIPGMSLCRDCRLWSNQRRGNGPEKPLQGWAKEAMICVSTEASARMRT